MVSYNIFHDYGLPSKKTLSIFGGNWGKENKLPWEMDFLRLGFITNKNNTNNGTTTLFLFPKSKRKSCDLLL